MAQDRKANMPIGSGRPPVSAVTLLGGLSGAFVEFGFLPYLLARHANDGWRTENIPRWSEFLLEKRAARSEGLDWLDIDPEDASGPRPPPRVAAEGAWRFAEHMGLIEAGWLTASGEAVARFLDLDLLTYRALLVPVLCARVESALVGEEGARLVPVLRAAAQRLSSTANRWARQCPGLLPVEVAAIVHWACIDIRYARRLARDIVTNRRAAMRGEGHPEPGEHDDVIAERHHHRTTEFYLKDRAFLGQVPISFGEESASARLLAYCGLFDDKPVEGSLDEDLFYLV